ncbi:PaaI family thioesterase [Hydrogenophaga crocea]|jgi:uncharacterized protein (TIGR00369 family)|uniref:PaaI family thioesterase n=1 Tax=Hydrogenophaga crocea TaxID=2716225 RepID=A0A6G8IK09_9BURK|nr:PaaI family thioesterase [Hydrogenophaga crocea]QIM53413.1 PaaI family thioesterase [Hydrogenophaga crocea]
MQAPRSPHAGSAHHDAPESVVDNPFLELIGVRQTQWCEGYAEFELPVQPCLLNRQGVLQGGVLSTLLDVACGYAGLYSPPGHEPLHGHTVSLTVNFINKGASGVVVAKGFLVQRARTLFFARGEAWLDGTLLLASAQGSFKLTGRAR